MATDGSPPEDIALLWKALYGLASVVGTGFLFLFGYIQRGKAALWVAVNAQTKTQSDGRLEDARLYATKHDLDQLGERLDDSIQQSERRLLDAIRDRPPVRSER